MIAGSLAHRAGGQALAAYLHGVKIEEFRLTGITLCFPNRTSRRTELLAELAVGLVGVAAISRYRFGYHEPSAPMVTWSFCRSQLEDLGKAHAIVGELAPCGDDDVFFEVWSQAQEVICSPLYWRTIERLAVIVVRDPLTGAEVLDVIDDVLVLPDEGRLSFPAAGGFG